MNQEWTRDNEKIIEHFRGLLLDTSSSLDLFQKIFSKVKVSNMWMKTLK